MPRKKNNQKNLSKLLNDKRIPFEDIQVKTMKVTIYALRWIFLLIFLFITIGIFVLLLTGEENYITVIIGYSIAGFFTFFMGYFGWILASNVAEMIGGREESEEHVSYYFKRKKHYKY